MTTFLVCPIDGVLPADNGTDTSKTNSVIPTQSDAVQTSSTLISSASATTVIVVDGTRFTVGDFFQIPIRNEKYQVTGIASNTLTILRAQKGTQASANVASGDVILKGLDTRGDPAHCPICGSATFAANQTGKVATVTAVVAASQVPADIDAWYTAQSDSVLGQGSNASPYVLVGSASVYPHKYATTSGGTVTRGTATVTPPTVNSVVGP